MIKVTKPFTRIRATLALIVAAAALGPLGSSIASTPPTAQPAVATNQPAASKKPNIVVILFDDAAFMDIGPYGSEAKTPNIDELAKRGMMFTRYQTSPLCSPTRAMLLTGLTNHQAGVATIPEVLPPEHKGKPGYRLHLEPNAATIAQRLKGAGYRTFMSGKWHLGDGAGQLPNAHGFDRSYALDASGADNWEKKSYMPYYKTAPWYEDDKPTGYPEGQFSSNVIVDRMIKYLDESQASNKPFLAYVAFQAVHIPVQAPREFTARYKGQFDGGWDVLRQARFDRAKALGFIPEAAAMPSRHDSLRAWSSLLPDEQALQAKAMEVYAGMMEATDAQIGRLVQHLKDTGQYENTIIVLTSDNGPEPSDPGTAIGFPQWMAAHGYKHELANLGERGSTNWIGPEWASAVATPGSHFKFYTSGGGIHVPLIVAGPKVQQAKRSDARAHVQDLAPTLLDLVGGAPEVAGAKPMSGRSLAPVLTGTAESVYDLNDSVGVEVSGNAALVRGDYKIVKYNPPYGDNQWRLYNVVKDPGETQDLSADLVELKTDLISQYDAFAQANGVLPMPEGYTAQKQVTINAIKRQIGMYAWQLALFGLGLCLAISFLGRWIWSAWRRKRVAVI